MYLSDYIVFVAMTIVLWTQRWCVNDNIEGVALTQINKYNVVFFLDRSTKFNKYDVFFSRSKYEV